MTPKFMKPVLGFPAVRELPFARVIFVPKISKTPSKFLSTIFKNNTSVHFGGLI